jgi:hypothetical protein
MTRLSVGLFLLVVMVSMQSKDEPVFSSSEPRPPTPYRSLGIFNDCESCQEVEKRERQKFDREYERYYDYQTYGRKIDE